MLKKKDKVFTAQVSVFNGYPGITGDKNSAWTIRKTGKNIFEIVLMEIKKKGRKV